MSSLQQALNKKSKKVEKRSLAKLNDLGASGSEGRSVGIFENSFAHGLDISELLSTNTARASGESNRTCAAEDLLRIKEVERRQRQIHEEEEGKMYEALQKRLVSLKDSNSKDKEKKRSSFEIGDALVRMHGTDDTAASILSRKKTNSRKKRTSHSKTNKSSLAAKKSRRAKF
mmetsp:Transcript_2402/g.5212  ORF Transcript_2402/g.5212 Transcript_2402/m.5212 type:complete len:173 (-) Transcript_2402:701-1219(-)|eukprot:CAMPEP_0168166088 /NCGR_PEP_ID=MMETSP0139_2-20121125/1833_1 /TAXON_ID=44445 /ORGANISM="Pseudo-nitzschia australis, Strain 10249 10 AB" /LENGTH=172 /DNA_ID=CAMNT_0008083247 /DNA_START=166 /DNA_END=684 /DNA_ORIENTATION=+